MDQLNDEMPESLARAMKALDDQAGRAAERVDATRVAEGVLRGLRQAPLVPAPRPLWQQRWMRIAAAVVLLAGGTALALQLAAPARNAQVAVGVPDSLSALQAQALLDAVDSLPVLGGDSVPALVITMESLNESELLTLLQTMDSSEDVL